MSHLPGGISWSSASNQSKPPVRASSSSPAALSSRTPPPGAAAAKKGSGTDTFSSLVSFGRDHKQNHSNLSLLEQQRQIEEQRRKDDEEKQRKLDALFGGVGGGGGSGAGAGTTNGFWNALDSKGTVTANDDDDNDDDILAAFNSVAPVDTSSHFPRPTPAAGSDSAAARYGDLLGDAAIPSPSPPPPPPPPPRPSDPFDLFDAQNLPPAQTRAGAGDDFDILGDLAKPVSELPARPPASSPPPQPASQQQQQPLTSQSSGSSGPSDRAVAEIMDMGFTAEQATQALEVVGSSGDDVQGAVGWLLEQAHQKSRPPAAAPEHLQRGGSETDDADLPAWARGSGGGGGREKDLGAYAAEVGGTLFKSANSLWSTGRRKMERAVAELKADLADAGGDPGQPKWMRERQIREELEKRGARGIARNDRPSPRALATGDQPPADAVAEGHITDEALMLEMGSGPPQPRRRGLGDGRPTPPPPLPPSSGDGLGTVPEREQARWQHRRDMEAAAAAAAAAIPDSASRKAKLAAESEPVYRSSNRRRPPPPPSATLSKPATPEPDLLGGGSGSSSGNRAGGPSLNPFARDVAAGRPKTLTPATTPPPPPGPRHRSSPKPRTAVPISPSAAAQSTAARQRGSEAFKRGDYAAAQALYTAALGPLPAGHPSRIVVLTNRSLCTVRLGDPKDALTDVEEVLLLIGDSRGDGETVSLDGGVEKAMKDYWAKAVSRKAECLEQLEKWSEAKAAWELALTAAAADNATSLLNGKRRCEAALKPKPKTPVTAPRRPRRPPPSRPPAASTAAAATATKPSGAVTALRQANAAQERQEAERLELHDVVHARIGNWKNGKEGNLRALLAGLDTVLWEGSGWTKVGMGELLVPQRCKVAYMKGIAKVHPDKIRPDATTEQRMIGAAVFSLLNDSWDKFKAENGL